jgi:hypothetical protein
MKEAWLHPYNHPSIHPTDFYQNKLNSTFQIKCFLLYSLNGTILLKRKKERKKEREREREGGREGRKEG